MQLNTMIFNYEGRLFRFKKEGDHFVCDICYWRGELAKQKNGSWSAEIRQKYDPFEYYQHDGLLQSQEEGMRWIASRLIKIEK